MKRTALLASLGLLAAGGVAAQSAGSPVKVRSGPGPVRRRPRRWGCAVVALALACPAAAVEGQDVPHARIAEVFRLGGADASEPFTYERRPDVVVTTSGLLLVRRASAGVVDVLDSDGRPIRSIGGLGEGPGEFRIAFGHGLVGDTLWIRNFPEPRISTFLLDGTHLETSTRRVDFGHPFSAPTGISGLLAGGRAYARPNAFVMGAHERIPMPLLVGDRELSDADTLVLQPNPAPMFLPDVGVFGLNPFPLPPLTSVAGDGTSILVAEWRDEAAGPLELRLFEPTGDLFWTRSLSLSRPPIPDRMRDSLVEHGVARAATAHERARERDSTVPRDLRELVEAGLSIPSVEPPVTRVVLGVDRSVWLRRSDGSEGREWLVLDGSGTPAFRVRLPASVSVEAASLDAIWATDVDALDIPYLVKYRIAR